MSASRIGLIAVLAVASAVTIAIQLYASRPWSGEAYRTGDASYLSLLAFMIYAISPTLGALLLSKLFRTDNRALMIFLTGAAAIAVCGVCLYIDSIRTPDAQGALVFLFVPFYQWLALPILTIVCLAIRNMRAMQ